MGWKYSMTLEEAEKIVGIMGMHEHACPTDKQREAKFLIFKEIIRKRYKDDNEVPPHLEPDYLEGWEE